MMTNNVNAKLNPRLNTYQLESLSLPEYGHNAVAAPRHNQEQTDPRSFQLGIIPNEGVTPEGNLYPLPPAMYHASMTTSTAVTQAPTTQQPSPLRFWSTGLFDCFEDCSSCILGTFCPGVLALTISCSLNECCCAGYCYPVALRTRVRTEHNIVGSICEDAYVMCWCYQCALCQIAREIDASSD